ncbi:hypothetical protein N7528_004018 [Penicillium herquei]|nr:hypothetical protein N7528_004018 [Penicillium herquei]
METNSNAGLTDNRHLRAYDYFENDMKHHHFEETTHTSHEIAGAINYDLHPVGNYQDRYVRSEGQSLASCPLMHTHDSSLFLESPAHQSELQFWPGNCGMNAISNASTPNLASTKELFMFQEVPSFRLGESTDDIVAFASSDGLDDANQLELPRSSNQVCYGSICDIKVELRQGPPFEIHNQESVHSFDVLPGPENFVICSYSTNEMIGFLNRGISVVLKALQKLGQIRLETTFTTSEWMNMAFSKPATAQNTAEISILGARDQSDVVGDFLSHAGLFLQPPRFDSGVPYHNPHIFFFPDNPDVKSKDDFEPAELDKNTHDAASGASGPSTEALSNILDNLHHHTHLHQLELASDDLLTIALLPYNHSITGLKTTDPPPGPFGGILADEMGLGKTLTTLATIISTRGYAETTMNTSLLDLGGSSSQHRSKATLIIVPSEVLMNQWLDEIKE